MKKIIITILFGLLPLFSITVDGYAFLEGETDHSGIEVILQRVAPDTNFRDTVFTNSLGYYTGVVDIGLYEGFFNYYNFYPDTMKSINAYSDVTIDSLTLLTKGNSLFGSISGIISSGVYNVIANISVDHEDSLFIQPGVTLLFDLGIQFDVFGYLNVEGNLSDSITFTSSESVWAGIRFYDNANDNSILDYCIIERSNYRGVYLDFCDLTVKNSTFRNNVIPDASSVFGGSIYGQGSTILIENCIFTDNNSATIYLTESNATFNNCELVGTYDNGCLYSGNSTLLLNNFIIKNNSSRDAVLYVDNSIVEIDSSVIVDNIGSGSTYLSGALRFRSSDVIVKNSRIENNDFTRAGGLISNLTSIIMTNCIVSGNKGNFGGGISLDSGTALIENSIITKNRTTSGAGITTYIGANIVNSNISKNIGQGIYASKPINLYNSIVSQNTNFGLYSSSLITTHNITNNCFYLNSISDYFQCNEYLGVIATTNTNSDPCDPWSNISLDPEFADPDNEDYRLNTDSPCIDAGTNTIADYEFPIGDLDDNYRIWDGDGNGSEIVDIGAYEYDSHSTSIENGQLTVDNYSLSQNYPNPFNPETTISYSLMNNAQVNLKVYDIAGREIGNLVDMKQNKGSHEVRFDGSMLTSGIYFYRLSVDGKVIESRKMMMLK